MPNKNPWWQGLECSYCINPASSEDHIPPRSLYKNKGKGLDLVVVPSCEECRKKTTKDDEFFKVALIKAAGDTNEVSKEHSIGSVKRALDRSVKLRTKLGRQTVIFDLVTESGIITGKQIKAIKMNEEDWRRIQVVLIRIVRGLNHRLSEWQAKYDDHHYKIIDFESKDGKNILTNEDIMSTVKSAKTIELGDKNVCLVKVVRYKSVENAHLWIFEFYESKRFFVFALPRDYSENIIRKSGGRLISRSGIIF